jgi:hypothetical protein
MKASHPVSLSEKYEAVIHLREVEGCLFREIGAKFGVSRSRAHCLYRHAVHWRDYEPECFRGLSCRTVQALENLVLTNREEVLAAVVSGKLTAESGPRNYGKKRHAEVLAWLGLPPT